MWTLTLDRPERRNALSTSLRDKWIGDTMDRGRGGSHGQGGGVHRDRAGLLCGVRPRELDRPRPTPTSPNSCGPRAIATTARCSRAPCRPSPRSTGGRCAPGGLNLHGAVRPAGHVGRRGSRIPSRAFGDVVYGPLHDLVGGALAHELTMGGRIRRSTRPRRSPRAAASSVPWSNRPSCGPRPPSSSHGVSGGASRRAGAVEGEGARASRDHAGARTLEL